MHSLFYINTPPRVPDVVQLKGRACAALLRLQQGADNMFHASSTFWDDHCVKLARMSPGCIDRCASGGFAQHQAYQNHRNAAPPQNLAASGLLLMQG